MYLVRVVTSFVSLPDQACTLWAVQIPLEGLPEVYVNILNSNNDEKTFRIMADYVFNGIKMYNNDLISSKNN